MRERLKKLYHINSLQFTFLARYWQNADSVRSITKFLSFLNTTTVSQQIRNDQQWMTEACQLAKYAAQQDEIPIGAILVTAQGERLAVGWNQSIQTHDPTAHAEIVALRAAATVVKNYRLPNTTLYVTLEPCVMCAGAIIHARIQRVVFGAYDAKMGAAGSRFDVLRDTRHNHQVECIGGILQEECSDILRQFFRAKRV